MNIYIYICIKKIIKIFMQNKFKHTNAVWWNVYRNACNSNENSKIDENPCIFTFQRAYTTFIAECIEKYDDLTNLIEIVGCFFLSYMKKSKLHGKFD